jgi:hypothetical protein
VSVVLVVGFHGVDWFPLLVVGCCWLLFVDLFVQGGTVQKVLEWLVFFEKNDENVKDFVLCFDAFVPLWKITSVLKQMHDNYLAEQHQMAVRRFAARLFEARCRDDPGAEGYAKQNKTKSN